MSEKTDNQLFIEYVNYLKDVKKFTLKAIAERVDVNYFKLRNITVGRSSANSVMLTHLIREFPELQEREKTSEEVDGLIEQYKSQIQILLKEKEHDKATIDKLLEIIKNYQAQGGKS